MASLIKSLSKVVTRGMLSRPTVLSVVTFFKRLKWELHFSARLSSANAEITPTDITTTTTTTTSSSSSTGVVSSNTSSMEDFKKSNTDIVQFLVNRDIAIRKKVIKIPFFTAGSYIAVTYADSTPAGINRFVGLCIAIRRNGLGTNILLRNVINNVAVEKLFEIYSPRIKAIEVLKLERRRRAKLYYLREKPLKFSTVRDDMKPVPHDGTVKLYRRKRTDPA